jgi:hypothetical protein
VLQQLVLKAREFSLIDFEKAAFKSFNTVFPRAKTIGCYFHFGQSLWRNFELKKHYSGELKQWFKRVLALAFLPHEEIRDMFCELMDEAPDLPDGLSLTPFFELDGYERLISCPTLVLLGDIQKDKQQLRDVSYLNYMYIVLLQKNSPS